MSGSRFFLFPLKFIAQSLHSRYRLLALGGLAFLSASGLLLLPFGSERAESGSLPAGKTVDLCALQKDFSFFTQATPLVPERSESLPCEELLATRDGLLLSEKTATPTSPGLASELKEIVSGFPIEEMVPAISTFDREIAGLIVGIGKKESNWGKRTPKLAGEECFNFWGYRGAGDRGLTPDGYGCWATPAAAVETIGKRLGELRTLRSSGTPERMVVWKCGSSCATHSPESVRKWIADVNLYYWEISQKF
ncbi:MAG: hypothetical protein ABI747_01745 [Candidatus Moraniibacteriota bacterium]